MTAPAFPTPDHIRWAQDSALRVHAATGFYRWPSVALGQALLESGGWVHLSGRNNGLGIKDFRPGHGTSRTTHETINGVDRILPQPFADFDTPFDCYLSHAYLFTRVGVYRDALTARDAESFIRAMSPHYATAPNYVSVLLQICRDRNLYAYDQSVAGPPVAAPPPSQASRSPAPVAGQPSLWSRIRAWFARL